MGRNLIPCIKCNSWVHKRFSGIQKCLTKAVVFVSRKSSGVTGNAEDDGDVTQDGDDIEKFSYFGNGFSSGVGVQEAVNEE